MMAEVRGPDRRAHDEGGAAEVGRVEDRVVEQQVLRTGLAVAPLPRELGALERLHRLATGHMHDVRGRAVQPRHRECALGGLALDRARARHRMVLGSRAALGDQFLLQIPHHVAVLGVHRDDGTGLGGHLHDLIERVIIDHDRALVGEEDLEARDAVIAHDGAHLVGGVRAPVGDGHVERVVRGRLGGAALPLGEPVEQRRARGGDAEVDDAGRAAGDARRGPGLEIIGAHRAHERQFHVHVRIDEAREHVAPLGIDLGVVRALHEVATDRDDRASLDLHIGGEPLARVHHGAATDQQAHRPLLGCAPPARACAGLNLAGTR